MKIKKNILVVDNGFFAKEGVSYFANSDTNKFFDDLNKIFSNVTVFQFHKKINKNENILNSKINCDVLSKSFKDSNLLFKFLSYFKQTLFLIMKIKKFDLLYVFFPGNINFLTLLISFLLKKKYAIYIRGEINFKNQLNRIFLKNAQFLVSNNTILKSKLENFNKNSHLIVSYLDLGNKLPSLDSQFLFPKKLSNQLKLLFVGRVEKRKGIFELIDSCIHLRDKKINFTLDILGGGSSFNEINELLIKYNLQKYVSLKGQISNHSKIKSYYKKSDIFILPSYTEGFPRVIYTAMEYGLPIITTLVGGIPSIMKDQYNCLSVSVESSSEISDAVSLLKKSNTLYTNLSKNSFETIKKLVNNPAVNIHKDILIKYFNN
tara:strand:- start:1654 stop:2781 length:1128 start_codon:yes stop_codon:yes gene_type:complete